LHPVLAAEDVVQELTRVYDPEIGLDIINLGLVYEVSVEGDTVKVWMTLTRAGSWGIKPEKIFRFCTSEEIVEHGEATHQDQP
jgi:hypothetical protein